jgi:hypothetical protein
MGHWEAIFYLCMFFLIILSDGLFMMSMRPQKILHFEATESATPGIS